MPETRRRFSVLGLLFVFQTLNFFDKLVFGLSAVPLMHELHLTPKQFGLIGSLFFLLFSVSGTLVGLFLIGRVRVKWILLAMALVWSTAQLPVFFTSSIAVLIAGRILLGAGEGPGLPTALNACYDWFAPQRRNVPSAIVLQGISAGYLLGSPLLTFVILRFGWRAGFLMCGVMGLAWALAWLLWASDGPYAVPPPTFIDRRENVPARTLWLDPTVLGVIVMSFASYYVVGMTPTWLPPYLRLGLGFGAQHAAWIISGVFAFQSPLLLTGSWLGQHLQRRGWSTRATLGHATTLTLLVSGLCLVVATRCSGVLQLALIGVGFAAPSLTTVFGPVVLGLVAPPAQRGRLIVVIYSANALAGLVSTYATGAIVGAAPAGVPAGFGQAISMAGLVLLVGAMASFGLIFPDRTQTRLGRAATSGSPRY